MIRYVPGTDPLDPMLLTAKQVSDLVARTRANMVRSARHRSPRDAYRKRQASLSRVGAHYRRFTGCSYAEAAYAVCEVSRLRITGEGVRHAWRSAGLTIPMPSDN